MEIKDYYIILKRNLSLIILITIIFALVAFFFTNYQKPTYQSSIAFEVSRVPSLKQSDVDYYQYENYYSSVVSASLATNLSDWLISPSTVTDIFNKSGYPLPTDDIKGLSKVFTVSKKQEASSLITASYSSADQEQARRIIATAGQSLKDRVDEYNQAEASAKYITRVDSPVVIAAPKKILLNTLIATFLGFVISLGIVSIKEALK